MTSLVSAPKPQAANFHTRDGALDDPLFAVWRNTRNAKPNLLRLGNRSWRLISERIFNSSHKPLDSSLLTLQDNPLVQPPLSTCTQMPQNCPSLFLNLARYTRNSSFLSLKKLGFSGASVDLASAEDSSDISDITDISEDEHALSEGFDCNPAQNQAFACPRRSAPGGSLSLPVTAGTRRASSKGNIFYISGSVSPHDLNKPGPRASLSHHMQPAMPVRIGRKDSLFKSTITLSESSARNTASSSLSSTDISEVSDLENQPSSLHEHDVHQVIADARVSRSGRSSKLMDDTESEWMSVSSDSELGPESPRLQPISFVKRIPIPQATSEHSTSSPPADDTFRSSPSSLRPRSLLSGLFLSEMNSSATRSPVSTKSADIEQHASKPVLKRSSTTGVITVDSNSSSRGMQRPSILLSKRYASSSDFTKKLTPYRSPISSVAEEDPAKEEPIGEEQGLLTKQTSSVGLSNFLAMADVPNHSQNAALGSVRIDQEGNTAGVDARLSSSLSKYSSWQRESSIRNILNKSSINLSSLFGGGIAGKLRLHSDSKSSESAKSGEPHHPETEPPLASLFAEHLSKQSLMEPSQSESTITTSKSVRVEPKSMKDFTPSVEISESLKDSLMIDHKLGKAPLPERVIRDEDLFSGHDKTSFIQESNDYHSRGW